MANVRTNDNSNNIHTDTHVNAKLCNESVAGIYTTEGGYSTCNMRDELVSRYVTSRQQARRCKLQTATCCSGVPSERTRVSVILIARNPPIHHVQGLGGANQCKRS